MGLTEERAFPSKVRREVPKLSVIIQPAWLHHASAEVVGAAVTRLINEARVLEIRITPHVFEIIVAVPSTEQARLLEEPLGGAIHLDVLQARVHDLASRILEEVHDAHLKAELARPLSDSAPCLPVKGRDA